MQKIKSSLYKDTNVAFWGKFMVKTAFYLVILLVLLYLYHFSHLDGSGFIYNEF